MIYIFYILIVYFINFLFKKKGLLSNNTGQSHQRLTENQTIPLTGGLFLIIFFFINFIDNIDILLFFSILFGIGVITDLGVIKSPLKRIIIQILFVILFIFYFDLSIKDLRVSEINSLLENNFFSYLFITLCFLVLINGSNFIDGNNGVVIGYFLIIFIAISKLSVTHNFIINQNLVINFSIFLTILLIFNLLNFFFLGDNGVYLVSIFTGYFLVNFINQNTDVSPYFIANLLWYPCFELLFSMIRKLKNKLSPFKPDTKHLHQLVFKTLSKKYNYPKNYINSFTGLVINLYNFMIIFICSLFYSSSNLQITLIFCNVVIYIISYNYLKKNFSN